MRASGSFSDRQLWLSSVLQLIQTAGPDVVLVAGASQRTDDGQDAIADLIFSNVALPASIAAELVKRSGKMLIVFGTSWQMADSNSYRPFNLYAATKQAAEDVLTHYALQGLRIASIRLFDTYGEDDDRSKLLNHLIAASLSGQKIDVTLGEQEIDLVQIDDVAEGVLLVLNELQNHDPTSGVSVYGLGTGHPGTVRDLITQLEQQTGRRINAKFGGRPYRDREVMKTWKNFRIPAGWRPSRSLSRVLAKIANGSVQKDNAAKPLE